MPIRINLLAEAQAAEELRRKDPVKRAIWVGVFLVFLVALWAMTLQFKILRVKNDLNSLNTKWNSIEKSYQVAVDYQRRSIEAEQKLAALQEMTTNRFLWGTVLNAFQQTLNGLDSVQVVRLKTDQSYMSGEETKARTEAGQTIPGHAATATERVRMVIDAVDSSSPSGGRVTKFKENIAGVPFFKESLQATNGVRLTQRSAPQLSPNGKNPFVMFQLEAHFTEKTR